MNETHNPAVDCATISRPAGALRLTTDPTGYMVLDDRPVRVGDYVCVWFGDRWMTVECMPPEYGMDTHFAARIPTMLGTSLVRMDIPDDAWFRWPPYHDRGGEWRDGSRA